MFLLMFGNDNCQIETGPTGQTPDKRFPPGKNFLREIPNQKQRHFRWQTLHHRNSEDNG